MAELTSAPITLLGAHGMLGRAFCQLFKAQQRPYRAFSRQQAPLTEADSLAAAIQGSSAVINCAAYTQVDAAEQDEDRATHINGVAVGQLARLCRAQGIPLVHFSTDYVFDGTANAPYSTTTPRAPINAYGRSKALGEELLENSGEDFLLIRTSWVYAPWGKNFVLTMNTLLREKETLRVVSDQRGRPTDARGLAESTLRLLDAGHRGTYHVTDAGECSWYKLTLAIQRLIDTQCNIEPCTTTEFPRPALRPAYSVLDLSEPEARIGPLAHYEARLASFLSAEFKLSE